MVLANEYRVYTTDINALEGYGEILKHQNYKSWICLISELPPEEIEVIKGVIRVILIT